MDVTTLIGLNYVAIRRAASEFLTQDRSDHFAVAVASYRHPAWEVRAFAVHLLGGLAAHDKRALVYLFEQCHDEPSWQVNEALAVAFDDYCAAIGYQQAVPAMRTWLGAPSPNLRRAVSEGLRPWTAGKRLYFASNPHAAIDLLGMLRDDDSRYVQESVGNALRDIGRKQGALVTAALRSWLKQQPDSKSRRTIARYALKQGGAPEAALRELIG